MNIEKLEESVRSLVTKLDEGSFIYDLLLAYGQPKASITRLKKGDYNRSANNGEVVWKKKLAFKHETTDDLHEAVDKLQNDVAVTKHQPRFIVVTDFETLLAVDTKTDDSLETPIVDLANHFDFFLPWSGLEKTQLQSENPADVKAAEKMGRLYDLILEDNPPQSDADRHALNIFLSRLLFCFFAEDTDIFDSGQFTNAVASHTTDDGSDLQPYLQKLFLVLSTEDRSQFPAFLQNFPYVNGGLFADEYPVPTFDAKSRKIILECGELNWKAINPDIFGSMIQAVVHPDQRGGLGMHYTSVVNIMKVIEPLFLNDLKDELERASKSKKKLGELLDRLYCLRIFDPACGSGNFLIIAYKELCKLEIEIFKRMYGGKAGTQISFRFESRIQLTQFYGIELDDFAHETAKLSMWLAEHQMNVAFKGVFGTTRPTLPLQDGGHIVCGNATRLDWEEVCPKVDDVEVFVLGNPPYLGASLQSNEQKKDMAVAFSGISGHKNLDYIAVWFLKASAYICDSSSRFAFVVTNSLFQGEQIIVLYPQLAQYCADFYFAYESFKWTNNARGNAGVTCSIVGVRNANLVAPKMLYNLNGCKQVDNISPYLLSGKNILVAKRRTPLAEFPTIKYGSKPADGGHLLLSDHERTALERTHSPASKLIKRYVGSDDYISGQQRFCLWIDDAQVDNAMGIAPVRDRIEAVRNFRNDSKKEDTRQKAAFAHRFAEPRYSSRASIIVPIHTSEKREYIPIGFLDGAYVISNAAFGVYDPPPWVFSVISSLMHTAWVGTVGGRIKTDFRYSSSLCYNTFPFPQITKAQESELEEDVFSVLDEREAHSEKTLAELYDPDKMPDGLRKAHHEMDLAVERCYRKKPFTSDEERLEYLFALYEKMIEAEKNSKDTHA